MTLEYDYTYTPDQVRVFELGESSFPIEKATEKERGEDAELDS